MSERERPTPEQAAAIGAAGRDVLLEAGAGTGKTGGDGRPLLPAGLRRGGLTRRDARLHLHRQGRGRAAPADPRRAGPARRRRAPSAPPELLGGIGGAWMTTIHGFCNRLLAGHPVAAGIDPRFRVLDAPGGRAGGAGGVRRGAGGVPRRRAIGRASETVGGLRDRRAARDRRRRPRGAAQPRRRRPAPARAATARRRRGDSPCRRGRRGGAGELKPNDAKRELVERALATLEGAAEPAAEPRRAGRRCASTARRRA